MCVSYVLRPCPRTNSEASIYKASAAAINDPIGHSCALVWPVYLDPTLGMHLLSMLFQQLQLRSFADDNRDQGGGGFLPREECNKSNRG